MKGKNDMKKTSKMATIGQLNRQTGNYIHTDRRVFEDESGNMFVKINGDLTDVDWLIMNGRTVHIWF